MVRGGETMKHYTLLVIGTVLVMVAAVMLAGSAYQDSIQDLDLVGDMSSRALLERINDRTGKELGIDEPGLEDFRYYFNTYNSLNLIFSDDRMDSVMNLQYDIGKIQPLDLKLFQDIMEIEDPCPEEEQELTEEPGTEEEQGLEEPEEEIKEITIPYGLNGTQISSRLKEKELIASKENFIKLLLKLGIDNKLEAGNYRFDSQDTAVEILLSLIEK